jgi:hypothetical protein
MQKAFDVRAVDQTLPSPFLNSGHLVFADRGAVQQLDEEERGDLRSPRESSQRKRQQLFWSPF